MNIFRFENIEALYLLLAIPLFALVYYIHGQRRKKAIKTYGDPGLLLGLMPDVSKARGILKFILLGIVYTSLVFALARPQFGSKLRDVKRKGIEVIIALDVSNSMLTEDLKPSRLERAKFAILKLIDRLENDKIGLVVFAGKAYVQVPITTDYSATKLFLNNVNTATVPVQGTSIASAIQLGMNSFSSNEEIGKALIIITDGEDHEGQAIEMAREATKKGVVIYTIGIGNPKGEPIPVYDQYGRKSFMKDKDGNVVVSKLNEDMLVQIASITNGKYVPATNTKVGLGAIFDEIDKMNKEEFEAKVFDEYIDRYQVLVWIALVLLILDFLVLERKNKLLKNINLFK